VFERYAIVSQAGIREAMTKLEPGQQREKAKAAREQKSQQQKFGQDLGGIDNKSDESESRSLPLTPQVN
jgi:hypothetical protein